MSENQPKQSSREKIDELEGRILDLQVRIEELTAIPQLTPDEVSTALQWAEGINGPGTVKTVIKLNAMGVALVNQANAKRDQQESDDE